jgi:nucleotide-binding universal stress UspA family protein
MTVTTRRISEQPAWLGTLFDRIACGVDGTESSTVAVAQAMRLLPARRTLELISVVERTPGGRAGPMHSAERERQYEEARRALRDARARYPRAHSSILSGDAGPVLVAAAQEAGATLIAVGAPASGRLGSAVLGSAGTHVLHSASCSVLIARPTADDTRFPRSVVVGHDDSKSAAAAAVVAKELAHRFDARLRFLVAAGGDPAQTDRLTLDDELEWSSLGPVEALTKASADADLLVVGSGSGSGDSARALGGVSERIGHLAWCSVLVVREPRVSPTADEVAGRSSVTESASVAVLPLPSQMVS